MNDQGKPLLQADISDRDIYEAMKEIPGYLDITPADFKEVYRHAYLHAFDRIEHSVHAGDLMTRQVHYAKRDTPIRDVAETLAANEISGIPVVDDGMRIVGIISEKDFCSHMGDRRSGSLMGIIADCLKNQGCFAMTLGGKKAEDIMKSPVITVHEDTTLGEIKALLMNNKINRLPVVDRDGRMTGIVSRADLIRLPFGRQS